MSSKSDTIAKSSRTRTRNSKKNGIDLCIETENGRTKNSKFSDSDNLKVKRGETETSTSKSQPTTSRMTTKCLNTGKTYEIDYATSIINSTQDMVALVQGEMASSMSLSDGIDHGMPVPYQLAWNHQTSTTTTHQSSVNPVYPSSQQSQFSQPMLLVNTEYGTQLLPNGSLPNNPPPMVPTALHPTTQQPCTTYPTVYVSTSGLITVLLKYDVAVEMTVDKNIRVVNHRHKAVAASNTRGNINCVYHVAAKVYQEGTRTEVECFGERRARMQTDGILLASGMEAYLLEENHTIPSQFCFSDMSKDTSVNILFGPGSKEFSNETLLQCEEITKNARYYFHKNGSTTLIINNIKIHQEEMGDVQVTSGPKFIATSPIYGSISLQTHFVEISAQVSTQSY